MFHKILKELRTNMGLTQRELAKKLNISNGTIAMYETGKRSPDYDTLNKIADFFDVSTDYLLGRNENNKDSNINKKVKTIDEELDEILSKLQSDGSALMFKGKPLNDATKIALLNSLKNIISMVEQMNEISKNS